MQEDEKKFSETLEDGIDEALYKVQSAVCGDNADGAESVPYTTEDPNGFRRINKHVTRRNLSFKLLKHPKILLAFFGGLVLIGIAVWIFS